MKSFEGPDGFRLRLVRTDPEVLEMEATYSGAAGMPPAHLHPHQDERFTVLEGAMRVTVDGAETRHEAGAAFAVPAGAVHQMAADGPARVRWEVRPPLRTAEFFERLHTRILTGEASPEEGAGFLAEYADVFRLAP